MVPAAIRGIKQMSDVMVKMHIAVTPEMAAEIAEIERREDRPRTRIMRRAVEDYLQRYREAHPDFSPGTAKRVLKAGLRTDVVISQGKRLEVIVLEGGGWRPIMEADYEMPGVAVQQSVLD